jgi:hypothetical protein
MIPCVVRKQVAATVKRIDVFIDDMVCGREKTVDSWIGIITEP